MITVRVADRYVNVTGLTWTSTDPGGFESCSFSTPRSISGNIAIGDEIRIFDGLETAWHGFVEEPGFRYENHQAVYNVGGVGYSAKLNQRPYSMVYIDRRLNEFGQTPLPREIALADAGGGYILNDNCGFEIKAGESSGNGGYPALVLFNTNINSTGTRHNIVETWYDAGLGNALTELSFTYETYDKALGGLNPAGFSVNWQNKGILASSDLAAGATGSDLAISGTVSVTSTASNMRYAYFEFFYNAVFGPTPGDWKFIVSDVRLKGNHGITSRGTAPNEGYYPSDIIRDAVIRSRSGFNLDIDNSSLYVIQQSAYKDKVLPSQIIEDTNKFIAWHWGVWEPAFGSDAPTFVYKAPPDRATLLADYRNCEEIDISQKFSETFNTALVKYSLPAGTTGYLTVYKEDTNLPEGIVNTVEIDAGVVGQSGAAETIGLYQLSLLQDNASIAGSLTLPPTISNKPSHLIRPGREKIKITNIPSISSSFSTVEQHTNVFRVKRLSVTVDNGVPRSQIEFDHGADLIEVMQARLANAVEARNVG